MGLTRRTRGGGWYKLSLESIQENGIQQLYAQNPSGEKINLNIKKGTDLLIDGAGVSGSLNTNATNISAVQKIYY